MNRTDIQSWETCDGITEAYSEAGAEVITISARVPRSSWTLGTNVRTWTVQDDDNNLIAQGEAEGLREAKKQAMAAFLAPRA